MEPHKDIFAEMFKKRFLLYKALNERYLYFQDYYENTMKIWDIKQEKWVYECLPGELLYDQEQFHRAPEVKMYTGIHLYFFPEQFMETLEQRVAEDQNTYVDGYDKDKFVSNGMYFPADLMRAVYDI